MHKNEVKGGVRIIIQVLRRNVKVAGDVHAQIGVISSFTADTLQTHDHLVYINNGSLTFPRSLKRHFR